MTLPDREARQEFDNMDSNNGGVVLFDEFCAYAVCLGTRLNVFEDVWTCLKVLEWA